MGVIAKGIPRGCQGLFTPVSLGYPLSVFNKNSTLKTLSGVVYFSNELGFSVESSLQRSSSIFLLWRRNDSSVVLQT